MPPWRRRGAGHTAGPPCRVTSIGRVNRGGAVSAFTGGCHDRQGRASHDCTHMFHVKRPSACWAGVRARVGRPGALVCGAAHVQFAVRTAAPPTAEVVPCPMAGEEVLSSSRVESIGWGSHPGATMRIAAGSGSMFHVKHRRSRPRNCADQCQSRGRAGGRPHHEADVGRGCTHAPSQSQALVSRETSTTRHHR